MKKYEKINKQKENEPWNDNIFFKFYNSFLLFFHLKLNVSKPGKSK